MKVFYRKKFKNVEDDSLSHMSVDKKTININILYKILILLFFAFCFLTVTITGKVEMYVNPKLVPLIVVCAFAFIGMAGAISRDLFKKSHNTRLKLSILIFIPPLIMSLLIPAKPVINSFESYNSTSSNISENQQKKSEEVVKAEMEEERFYVKNNKIIIDDPNFYLWTEEIYSNSSKYIGKDIELKAFVYKDKDVGDKEIIAARVLMACCAADTQTIGFLCKYKNAYKLQKNTWYIFSGKLNSVKRWGKVLPLINIQKVQSIKKPKDEYVYP